MTQLEKQIVGRCITREGGFKLTDAENDRGGLTFAGVTLTAMNRWRTQHAREPLTAYEFRARADRGSLSLCDEVRRVYRDDFLAPLGWISPVVLREIVFDAAVTSGVPNATRILQRAVGSNDDGVAGPNTEAAARAAVQRGVNRLLVRFTRERVKFFVRIVQADPTQAKWLWGWIRRAFDLLDEGSG